MSVCLLCTKVCCLSLCPNFALSTKVCCQTLSLADPECSAECKEYRSLPKLLHRQFRTAPNVSGRIPVWFDNKPCRNWVILHFWGSPHDLLSNKTGILQHAELATKELRQRATYHGRASNPSDWWGAKLNLSWEQWASNTSDWWGASFNLAREKYQWASNASD